MSELAEIYLALEGEPLFQLAQGFVLGVLVMGSVWLIYSGLTHEEDEDKELTMSGSKWRYSPEKCDGDFCLGECDNCPKCWEDADDDEEERAYGDFITLDETTELKELSGRKQVLLSLTQMEQIYAERKDYANAAVVHELITMLKEADDAGGTD